jgi:hypothetical protein
MSFRAMLNDSHSESFSESRNLLFRNHHNADSSSLSPRKLNC